VIYNETKFNAKKSKKALEKFFEKSLKKVLTLYYSLC